MYHNIDKNKDKEKEKKFNMGKDLRKYVLKKNFYHNCEKYINDAYQKKIIADDKILYFIDAYILDKMCVLENITDYD